VKDRGIAIQELSKNGKDLEAGVKVDVDFLGNPIVGRPDIGAIEVQ
jgi:hypothetical protein